MRVPASSRLDRGIGTDGGLAESTPLFFKKPKCFSNAICQLGSEGKICLKMAAGKKNDLGLAIGFCNRQNEPAFSPSDSCPSLVR